MDDQIKSFVQSKLDGFSGLANNIGNAVGGAAQTVGNDISQGYNQVANPQNTPNLPFAAPTGPSQVGNLLQGGLDAIGKTPLISPVTNMGVGQSPLTLGDVGRALTPPTTQPDYPKNGSILDQALYGAGQLDPMMGGVNGAPIEETLSHYGGQILTRIGSGMQDVVKNFQSPEIQNALAGQQGFFRIESPAVKLFKPEDLISHEGAPDLAQVEQYKQQLQNGTPVQPLYVTKEGDKYGIVDGQHRYAAATQLGYNQIPAIELKQTPIDQVKAALQDQSGKIQIPGGQGEKGLNPNDIQKYGQDLESPQGKQAEVNEYQKAAQNKPVIDNLLNQTAQDTGGRLETNFKNPDTFTQKIVEKRADGRPGYDPQDVNDTYRGRLIYPDRGTLYQAKDQFIDSAQKAGLKIGDQDDFFKNPQEGGYQGYHVDLEFPNGQHQEVQFHTEKSLAASLATHDVHAQYGDELPKAVGKQTSELNHQIMDMPNSKAQEITQGIEQKNAPTQQEAQAKAAQTIQGNPPPVPWQNPSAQMPGRPGLPGDGFVTGVKKLFDPTVGVPEGTDIKNSFRSARGQFDYSRELAYDNSKDPIKAWDKFTPDEHLQFINGIESAKPFDDPRFPGTSQEFKDKFAQDYQIQQSIRPDAPFRDNYFTHNGVWRNPEQAQAFLDQWRKQSMAGGQNFFKQRAFPTIYDGIKAGLEVKETNPEKLYLNNHVQVLKAKMADDFAKSMEASGMPKDAVQSVIDRYMDPGIKNNVVYQNARQANSALNGLQLGLSAFHFTTTSVNSLTSKMALGVEELSRGDVIHGVGDLISSPVALFQNYLRGNQMLADAFAKNPQLTADVQHVLQAGGRFKMPEIYRIDAWDNAIKNLRSGDPVSMAKGAAQLPMGIIEQSMKPLMNVYVPRIKLGAFADLASSKLRALGPEATPELQRKALADAWDSIDNRFGQLVQDNLFWKQTLKDVGNITTRSMGWNLGTIRELGGGALDALKAPADIAAGRGISSRTAYALTLPIATGIMSATYTALHGQKPDNLLDYIYPRTGQTKPDGKPERVVMPGYMKDTIAYGSDPVRTLLNKQSPILSTSAQLLTNKDFKGKDIRNPKADALTQTGQLGAYVGNQLLPFTFSGNSPKRLGGPEASAEQFFGFTPASKAVSSGDIANTAGITTNGTNTQVNNTGGNQQPQGQLTPLEQQKIKDQITQLRAQEKQVTSNTGTNVPILGQVGGLNTQQQNNQLSQLQNQITQLQGQLKPKVDYTKVPLTGDPEMDSMITKHQQAQLNAEVNQTLKEYADGKISAKDAQDRISTLKAQNDALKDQSIDQAMQAKLTGNPALDAVILSKQKSAITAKINDVMQDYQAGNISAKDANQQISDLKAQQQGISSKIGGGSSGSLRSAAVRNLLFPKKVTARKTTPAKVPVGNLKAKGFQFKFARVANAKKPKLKLKA